MNQPLTAHRVTTEDLHPAGATADPAHPHPSAGAHESGSGATS